MCGFHKLFHLEVMASIAYRDSLWRISSDLLFFFFDNKGFLRQRVQTAWAQL